MTEVLQQCSCEEATEEELLARLDEVIAGYKDKPGALIPVLQLAQGIFGYLPEVGPQARRPQAGQALQRGRRRGRLLLVLLDRAARQARHPGLPGDGLLRARRRGRARRPARRTSGIDVGDTTDDRSFSLEVGRCFGACGLAPVIMIDDDVHHRVKPKRIGAILEQYADDAAAAERSA